MKDLSKKLALGLTMATKVAALSDDKQDNLNLKGLLEVMAIVVVGLTYGCIKSIKENMEVENRVENIGMNRRLEIMNSRVIEDDNSEITIVVDDNYETKSNVSDITCVNKKEADITEQFNA